MYVCECFKGISQLSLRSLLVSSAKYLKTYLQMNKVIFILKIPDKMNQSCQLSCEVANITGFITKNKGPCMIKLKALNSGIYFCLS